LKILFFIAVSILVFALLRKISRPTNSKQAVVESTMSVQDALGILGLKSSDPELAEVISAHKRLMQRLHPDKGGSAVLAQQLNEAKRVLLARRGSSKG
jgi:hypothetical protein